MEKYILIKTKNITTEMIEKTLKFHGHWCPGLALGIRISEKVLAELGHSSDEEIIAIAETDFCGVDAVQFLTGCTVGKGNLLIRDHGKIAFSFYRRNDGRSLRIVAEPLEHVFPHTWKNADNHKRARDIMEIPFQELFRITEVRESVPDYAPVKDSMICQQCGEAVMETKTRISKGRILCKTCFEKENSN